MTTDSRDACCRSLDSSLQASQPAPASPSFASSPSFLLLPTTTDILKPSSLHQSPSSHAIPSHDPACAGEVVSSNSIADSARNNLHPVVHHDNALDTSLASSKDISASMTKVVAASEHPPSTTRSSYKDALVSTLLPIVANSNNSSLPHSTRLPSDSHEASHHHNHLTTRRKRSHKDEHASKPHKRGRYDHKTRSRSRSQHRTHRRYDRHRSRSPSYHKSSRGNANKYSSSSSSLRSRGRSPSYYPHHHHSNSNSKKATASQHCLPHLPPKIYQPRNPKFSDLPLEWWERGEACKDAKSEHVIKIDDMCESREFLVLNTTLWQEDTVLELNMFPYDTPPGIAHYTLWSRFDLQHADIVEYVDRWLEQHFPQVRRWQYDDNSGERSILLFHVHVFVEMDPFSFTPRPGQEYFPPHMSPAVLP